MVECGRDEPTGREESNMFTVAIEGRGTVASNVGALTAVCKANTIGGLVMDGNKLVAFFCGYERKMKATDAAPNVIREALA